MVRMVRGEPQCDCGDDDCAAVGYCLNEVTDFYDDPSTGTTELDYLLEYQDCQCASCMAVNEGRSLLP